MVGMLFPECEISKILAHYSSSSLYIVILKF